MATKKSSVNRRRFLKGAAVGAAALVAKPTVGTAQQPPGSPDYRAVGGGPGPSADLAHSDRNALVGISRVVV